MSKYVLLTFLLGLLCLCGCENQPVKEPDNPKQEQKKKKQTSYKGKTLDQWIAQLADKKAIKRDQAAEALGMLKNKVAVLALIKVLKNDITPVRICAMFALAMIKDPSAVPELVNALEDENIYIRGLAAKALGIIGKHSAIDALIKTLMDKDEYVRGMTAAALKNITKQDFGEDAAEWQKWWLKNKESVLKEKGNKK